MARLASVPDLERELDRLYGVPLDRFVAERDALAGRLRQAHQSDAAATVAKLKKPVAVAWAANRLARLEPKAVARLLAASAGLRDAQKQALAGRAGHGEVGTAQAAEHEAVRDLVEAARTKLDPPVSGSALDRLGQTLRAAAASPPTRKLLERGRLTGEVQATGFDALDGIATRRPRRTKTDEVAQAARARLRSLREESRRLSAAARSAERSARTAERTASTLRAEAETGKAAAERAAAAVAQAEAELELRNT
jgi:hypothetical protein